MGFFTSGTFLSATTNTGTFKATCQSFMLLPSLSAATNGEPITTSFTSLNNYFGFPPWLFDLASGKRIFSGECKRHGEGYGAYYVHEKPRTNNSLEWGALQFQIPTTDLDGNGLVLPRTGSPRKRGCRGKLSFANLEAMNSIRWMCYESGWKFNRYLLVCLSNATILAPVSPARCGWRLSVVR